MGQAEAASEQSVAQVAASETDVRRLRLCQVHDAVEVAAAEFEGTAQVEVAQIERGDDECPPYSYRSGRPEAGVEVSPAGEQLVQQLGADLSVRFPRLALRGVVVIESASAQVEPAPLGGELAQSPLCRREVGGGEQLRHPSILGRRRTQDPTRLASPARSLSVFCSNQ